MSDYLKNTPSLRTFEGSVAKVQLYPDEVIWSPASTAKTIELDDKARKQNEFVGLTKDIPFLNSLPVKVLDQSKHTYLQSRAKGFNLAGSPGEVQKGGYAEFFSQLSLPVRLKGFNTYLKVIGRLHEKGRLFNDHKADSVFIDPSVGLSLPDTDKMSIGATGSTLWEQEVRNNGSALESTLRSFFTRNVLTSRYIPDLIKGNLNELTSLSSAEQLLEVVQFMVDDGPKNGLHNGLMVRLITEEMEKLGLKIPKLAGRDDLTPFQADLDELRQVYPSMGINTSTSELIAHMQLIKQRQEYFMEKDKNEYLDKII